MMHYICWMCCPRPVTPWPFADGLSYAEFTRDRRYQLAILKSVEIVGEAASRLSAQTRESHPDIP